MINPQERIRYYAFIEEAKKQQERAKELDKKKEQLERQEQEQNAKAMLKESELNKRDIQSLIELNKERERNAMKEIEVFQREGEVRHGEQIIELGQKRLEIGQEQLSLGHKELDIDKKEHQVDIKLDMAELARQSNLLGEKMIESQRIRLEGEKLKAKADLDQKRIEIEKKINENALILAKSELQEIANKVSVQKALNTEKLIKATNTLALAELKTKEENFNSKERLRIEAEKQEETKQLKEDLEQEKKELKNDKKDFKLEKKHTLLNLGKREAEVYLNKKMNNYLMNAVKDRFKWMQDKTEFILNTDEEIKSMKEEMKRTLQTNIIEAKRLETKERQHDTIHREKKLNLQYQKDELRLEQKAVTARDKVVSLRNKLSNDYKRIIRNREQLVEKAEKGNGYSYIGDDDYFDNYPEVYW